MFDGVGNCGGSVWAFHEQTQTGMMSMLARCYKINSHTTRILDRQPPPKTAAVSSSALIQEEREEDESVKDTCQPVHTHVGATCWG